MDVKEKERKRELTDAEKRRLELFNDNCYDLERQGYRKTELTISIVKANIFAMILAVPVGIVSFGLFYLKNGADAVMRLSFRELIIFIFGMAILTVLHEFVHGFTWGLFSEHYFKDIEFGIMKGYMTPYCTCTMPLKKNEYIAGALMPLITLGIMPTAASIFNGSYMMLLLGFIMIVAAAGDIMIVHGLLKYNASDDVLCLDHPTMGGLVVFERQDQDEAK